MEHIVRRVYYNSITKRWHAMRSTLNASNINTLEIDFTHKVNYMTLGVCGLMGLWAFKTQFNSTKVRGITFGRNHALIDEKYGKIHEESLGEGMKISKYGYPDMGNNIYSDLLPYRDWIKINNAQRCHENFVSHLPVFYTSLFVSAISYPRFAFIGASAYLMLRIGYTNAYNSHRGHNRATALEEFLKLTLLLLVFGGVASSFRVMGLSKLPIWKKMNPFNKKKVQPK